MERCRHCGSERIVKTGHRDGQQKWRCKDCGKFQGEKDRREKYTENEKNGRNTRALAKVELSKILKKDRVYRHQQ